MAKRQTQPVPHPFAEMIKAAWKASGLSIEEVAFRYRAEATRLGFTKENGMLKGMGAVKSWCYGWSIPQLHQYDVLARVLPELARLEETDESQQQTNGITRDLRLVA